MLSLVFLMGSAMFLMSFIHVSAEELEPTIPPELLPTSVPNQSPDVTTIPIASTEPEATDSPAPTVAPTAKPTATPIGPTEAEKKKIDTFTKTKVTKVTISKSVEKKVKLTWKKQMGAKDYVVFRSEKKSTGYKSIGTVKKTKYTDKKAKKRKTYYYRIQARMKFYGKLYSGKSSTASKVYVTPKTPCTVIAGECFVDGMKSIRGRFPKNIHLVAKIGVNTYTMQHNNYFNYKGQSITGLERIAYYYPDRVYFLIGANESAWTNTGFTMKNYKRMVKLLKKVNKHIEIVLMKIAPFGYSSPENIPSVAKRAQFNKAYSDYAKKTDNVFYCDATDVLDDGTSHLLKKYDDGDGCHWNTNGTIRVVDEMKQWSKKKFGNW